MNQYFFLVHCFYMRRFYWAGANRQFFCSVCKTEHFSWLVHRFFNNTRITWQHFLFSGYHQVCRKTKNRIVANHTLERQNNFILSSTNSACFVTRPCHAVNEQIEVTATTSIHRRFFKSDLKKVTVTSTGSVRSLRELLFIHNTCYWSFKVATMLYNRKVKEKKTVERRPDSNSQPLMWNAQLLTTRPYASLEGRAVSALL